MNYLDPTFLISTLGLLGICAILFAESGILLGAFLPGDSLLFAAGIFAGQGYFPFWLLIILAILSAFLGDNVGYWFGKKFGPRVFAKEESFFFKKSYIKRTEEFYAEHGKKTVAIARFVPIVRTFAPIMAGIGSMDYKAFLKWNILGSAIWVLTFTSAGLLLHTIFPESEKLLTIVTLGIVAFSFVPPTYQIVKARRKKRATLSDTK